MSSIHSFPNANQYVDNQFSAIKLKRIHVPADYCDQYKNIPRNPQNKMLEMPELETTWEELKTSGWGGGWIGEEGEDNSKHLSLRFFCACLSRPRWNTGNEIVFLLPRRHVSNFGQNTNPSITSHPPLPTPCSVFTHPHLTLNTWSNAKKYVNTKSKSKFKPKRLFQQYWKSILHYLTIS